MKKAILIFSLLAFVSCQNKTFSDHHLPAIHKDSIVIDWGKNADSLCLR